MKTTVLAISAAAVALAIAPPSQARDQIRIVGSSTVFPFATAVAEQLQKRVFPDLRVGMVHGRMKGPDKDAVMQDFAANFAADSNATASGRRNNRRVEVTLE